MSHSDDDDDDDDDADDTVAEELEESLDESLEEENYSDDNFSEENNISVKAPLETSVFNLDTLTLSPVSSNAVSKVKIRDAPSNKNVVNTSTATDDGDNYSLSFDEDSDNNTVYSQDFDMSLSHSSPSKKSRQGSQASPKQQLSVSFQEDTSKGHSRPATSNDLPNFPSLAIQSLEVERAMEKLSKEIVYLRSQQRIALRDRREEARSKKLRAEERRQQHQRQLAESQQQVMVLQLEKQRLTEEVRVLETSLVGAEEARALLSGALEASKVVLEGQRLDLQSQQQQVARGQEELRQQHVAWEQERASLAERAEEQRSRLVTAELHVAVMAKSNEAAEERLARDRSTLPALHQDLLDERLRHLAGVEESARRREQAAQSEQATRLLLLDSARKEMHAELDRRELRLAAEIDAKRADLVKEQQQLRHDMDKYSVQKVEDASEVERKLLSIRREELALAGREKALAQRESEFSAATRAMEPELLAGQRDREEARELQRQSARVLQQAEQREQRAGSRLEELQAREAAVDAAWTQVERSRSQEQDSRARALAVAREGLRDRALLEGEREKLRGIGVALTNQFHMLQKAAMVLRAAMPSATTSRRSLANLPSDLKISDAVSQALGEVEANQMLLDLQPHYSEELALLLEQEESENRSTVLSPESHSQRHSYTYSRRHSGSESGSEEEEEREQSLSPRLLAQHHDHQVQVQNAPYVERTASRGNKGTTNNKSWDSLNYSALSLAQPSAHSASQLQGTHRPGVHHNDVGHSGKFSSDRYRDLKADGGRSNGGQDGGGFVKENVEPSKCQQPWGPFREQRRVETGREHTFERPSGGSSSTGGGSVFSSSLRVPGDLVGGATVTTEAMRSAALRYGVVLAD